MLKNFYSGFWKRLIASIIDTIVLIIPGNLLRDMIGSFLSYDPLDPESNIYSYVFLSQLVGICLIWLYDSILESSKWQATLGKIALGIVVTDENGSRITWSRATGRYFCKILSAIPIGLGFLIAGFTKRKQAFHDIVARTYVINKQIDQNHIQISVELIKDGDYKTAVILLTRIIESDLQNKNVYYYRAIANSKLGNKQIILKDIKIAARYGHEKAIQFLQNRKLKY